MVVIKENGRKYFREWALIDHFSFYTTLSLSAFPLVDLRNSLASITLLLEIFGFLRVFPITRTRQRIHSI
jgi:hypothetical protein